MTFVNLFLSDGMNDKFFSVYCNSIYLKVKYKQKHFSPNFHWYHNKNCLMVSKSLLLHITLLLF